MENTRDSFIFYRSFYEAIKELPPTDKANLLDAICELSLNFQEIELSGISKSFFILIKPQIEANLKRYENGKKPKNKQDGSKKEAKEVNSRIENKADVKQSESENGINSEQKESKAEAKRKQKQSKPVANDKQNGSETEANVNVNNNVKEVSKDTGAKASIFFFKKELMALGIENQLAEDWVKVRKNKKASNTRTAFASLCKEFEKSRLPPNDCVKLAVENSWAGFKASWLEDEKKNGQKHYQKNNRTCKGW